ncbi:hypothetical protein PVAND_009191 [Polypedilum vanderplanki]|uniref:Protein kinase domain-containing protein n=1 Tax=Polypedilum vanderplanki TaxID=319348 RepID=A0A9J6CBV8_POLVA|nr:hypothetical protein PVAND_009191 [Polypedilum vanderplanki]
MIIYSAKDDKETDVVVELLSEIGKGAFAKVFCAKLNNSKFVAVKQVSASFMPELEIMRKIACHPNIRKFYYYYYTTKNNDTKIFRNINFILELMPMDLLTYIRELYAKGLQMKTLQLKAFAYQLFKSLGYLHSLNICHRDIKPANILIRLETYELKLSDFGCAKELSENMPSTNYICSRYYRAPELVFGATQYSNKIDIWSAGCCIVEMLTLDVLFLADSNIELINQHVRMIGIPSQSEMNLMKANFKNSAYIPKVSNKRWPKKLLILAPPKLLEFLSMIFLYNPNKRMNGYEACGHSFFNELRGIDSDEDKWNSNLTEAEITAINTFLAI